MTITDYGQTDDETKRKKKRRRRRTEDVMATDDCRPTDMTTDYETLCDAVVSVAGYRTKKKKKVKGDRSPDAVCGQAGVSGLTTGEGAVPVTEEPAGPAEEAGTEDGEIAAAAGDSQAESDSGRILKMFSAVQGQAEEGSCSFARHWCGAGGSDRQEAADRGQRATAAGRASEQPVEQ